MTLEEFIRITSTCKRDAKILIHSIEEPEKHELVDIAIVYDNNQIEIVEDLDDF